MKNRNRFILFLIAWLMPLAMVAQSNHWTPQSAGYEDNMTLTGVIQINGVEQESTTLEVGAFCGTECRGSARPVLFPATGRYLVFLTLYGNDGDQITFKLYDHSQGAELNLQSPAAITFGPNGLGSLINPYVLNFTAYNYTITASASPSNGGTISGAGTYPGGSTCTLTATPATGYSYVRWTKNGSQVSTNPSYSFTVTGNASYVAVFSLNSYTISVSANLSAGGTVSGGGTYNYGSSCTLTATPATGYSFVRWTKNGSQVSTNPSYSFTVTGNASYVAVFSLNSYTISVSANPPEGGTVSGGGTYDYGSSCTLTATPATGYSFVRWTKNGSQVSTNPSYSFTVTGNASYVAVFSLNSYTISASANPAAGGTVSGGGTYNYGSSCTLTATPTTGYSFVRWTKNGSQVSTNPSYNFTVTGNASYVAVFSLNSYTISASSSPSAGGSVSGAGSYNYGSICTLTATPATGYSFVRWTKNGSQVSTNANYSFTVTENASYVAEFNEVEDYIVFVDPNVKAICIANWDTNGSGELSYAEAAAVTSLGDVFSGDTTITSFEELQYFTGLSEIGAYAFHNCSNLTGSLNIPNSVTSIRDFAFYGCSGFTGSLTIPNTVTSIGFNAFGGCSGFTGTLTISASVTSIGFSAFYGCSGFTGSLTIPNSVTSIGTYAFSGCSGFTGTLTLPNSITSIGGFIFRGCSGFTGSLTIPNSVTSIESSAFDGCSGFTGILTIPESVTSIGSYAFCNCSGFTGSLTIPNSVTSIGDNAFYYCSGFMGTLTIPSSVTSIGRSAFCGCSGFTGTLTIPNSIISIGEFVFKNCSSFTGTLTIPNSVTSIGYCAFIGCSGFTGTLTIPDSVTSIGDYAFQGCSGFTSMIILPEAPPTLGSNVFYGIPKSIPVNVPCASIASYQAATGWSEFTNYHGIDCPSYVISATANPAEGGTIEGGGTYDEGETCTLTAAPNEGFGFVAWTEEGEIVSTDAVYEFVVTDSRNLIANFATLYLMDYSASPSYAGRVGSNKPTTLTQGFEDGFIPADWNNIISSYPWIIWSSNPHTGSYCMATSNYNWSNSESFIEATMEFVENGSIEFYSRVSSESVSWDWGAFYIDGTEQFREGGTSPNTWTLRHYDVSAGTHTFRWYYRKDGSINSGEDRYFIDDIVFTGIAGGDVFCSGETCVLTATPNEGYTFVNWTENGEEVSTENPYSFTVTGNRNLVANFALNSYDIIAEADPGEGGTVSGAGNYNHFETCTLTATANIGYIFMNWTENGEVVSTEATYSFTVTEDRDLVANFEMIPEGALNGLFTVGQGQQVYFSQGNLQYIGSAGNGDENNTGAYWKFADNQWDYFGDNGQEGDSPTVDRDLFAWGTSGYAHGAICYQPWSHCTNRGDHYAYGGYYCSLNDYAGQADWGYNAISNGGNTTNTWRTLNKNEWRYLFYYRNTITGIRYAMAQVAGFDGVVLLPDDWNGTYYTFNSANNGGADYSSNIIDSDTWSLLEADGAVFLRATHGGGTRYWSSENCYEYTESYDRAYALVFWNSYLTASAPDTRDLRECVRLVRPVVNSSFIIEIGASPAEYGTVNGGGVYDYGTTCTLMAIANDNYAFMYWTENGKIVSIEPNYMFRVTANRSLEAHFGVPLSITATSNPIEGGVVTGDGEYDYGSICTLMATANEGYTFMYWTENGNQVSTDTSYSFTVTANRGLVAHFALPFSIAVSANPTEGGVVYGAGDYNYNATCTLMATPNEGYSFIKWTKNGETVSYLSPYSITVTEDVEFVAHFEETLGTNIGTPEVTNLYLPSYSYYNYTLSQQIYTPDEIGTSGFISSIGYFNVGETKTRSYDIYMVHTDKNTFENNTDWITVTEADRVFSGEVTMTRECWNTILLDVPFDYDGTSNLAIIIDDNSGNWTYSPHMECRVFNTEGNQAIRVYGDNTNYDPMSPPSSYANSNYVALHSVKNQMIFGVMPAYHFVTAGTWGNAANWSGGALPGAGDAVFIDANCALNRDAEVAMLAITPGQVLTLRPGKTLSVTGNLYNTAIEGLVVEDGAQLVNTSYNVAATVKKNVQAYNNSNPDGWYTISSPMNGMVIEGSNFLTPGYDLYRFNETNLTHDEWENYKVNLADFTIFEKGRGYLYANSNTFAPAFTGILNNMDVTYTLTCTERPNDPLSGFNLIGNPFPHEIYKGAGGAINNVNLASGYYTLTNEGTWEVHSFDDAIQPGQGFLVKATAPTVLTIAKSNEMAFSESGDAKKGVTERMCISVAGDNGQDRTYVYFGQGVGLDKKNDFDAQVPNLWIRDNGHDYAIAHVEDTDESLELCFSNRKEGDFTLAITTSDTEFEYLQLIDRVTGVTVDLMKQSVYTFHSDRNESTKRFTLAFKKK